MSNNNRNGKEVHRGQMPDNIQKESNAKPVNRIRKRNDPAAKNNLPGEPKKISLNVNKNPDSVPKSSSHKGQVIKLEDKDPRIHPVETPSRKNRRSHPRPRPASDDRITAPAEAPVYKVNTDNKTVSRTDKDNINIAGNAGKWLLIAAVILFVAWAVIFFYYNIGGNSHMILALAVICAIVSLIGMRKK